MSFFYGYKKHDIETIGGLPTTGGEMTGDINMANNKIITSADPTADTHLTRKKYVDDKVASNTNSGNIDMGNNKIFSSIDPTGDKHLARKKYVDDQDNKKLTLTGGTVTGLTTFQQRVNLNNEIHLHGDKRIYNYQTDSASANSSIMLINRDYSDRRYLKKSGGTLTGDVTIGNHKIISSSDPTLDTHLTRKKYIDDEVNKKVSKSGDTMTGNLDIGNNKIFTTADPTGDKHLCRKKYVDIQDAKKISKSGDTMTGDLDMGNHNILHTANYIPSSDNHGVNKKYVKNWSYPNTTATLYLLQMDDEGIFDPTKDDIDYVEYTGSNKKVETLFNLSRKKNWNFGQSDTNKQPFFKKSTINNNFYCIEYPGSNNNNLHLNTSQDILSNQYLNFYFVYSLKSLNSTNREASLFKITKDKLPVNVVLLNDIGISYILSELNITNAIPTTVPNNRWQLKANATELNKLICLSCHWDQNNTSGNKKGKLYVNGKEIFSFTTSQKSSHHSNTKFYLGSKNKDYGQLDGEILYVYVSMRKMKEKEITLNYKIYLNRI